jgi:hypothetical protein
MMQSHIEFAPLIPQVWLIVAGVFALLIAGLHIAMGKRGGLIRLISYGFIVVLFTNPALRQDRIDPLSDVAVVMVDRSASQEIDTRDQRSDDALKDLQGKLDGFANLDVQVVEGGFVQPNENVGTALFKDLSNTLAAIDPERLAGVFLITDGQIHDIPDLINEEGEKMNLGLTAPVHALITGRRKEVDRKLTLVRAPRFGIVGQKIDFSLRIDDFGISDPDDYTAVSIVKVTASRDGEDAQEFFLATGAEHRLSMDLTHGGESIVEFNVEPLEGELTEINNSAIVLINGVRDRLRVLLVSGEPHAGERTWRNLLKADPAVDLVHFTILRPPEKQDGTPTQELSLISFPTRQLFAQKLDEFDLVIFDRYRRRGVLPIIYLSNIARYVSEGGALLTAAGPSFATPYSLFRTPLAEVLPARPSGEVLEGGFRPKVSEGGARHPVTANLPGANDPMSKTPSQAQWGRWFRLVGVDKLSGETLMVGPDQSPLLILDRFGEGRVAQLMSDHAWLWTRGYEGGGPQAELLRRLAHWLMKEPELEEEVLRAVIRGNEMEITRRTMAGSVPLISVNRPSGEEDLLSLDKNGPGLWSAIHPAEELGLYRITDGNKTALAIAGPVNPREFLDVLATDKPVLPLTKETGGKTMWLVDQGVPNIKAVRRGKKANGRDWLGIERNHASIVTDTTRAPLIPPLLGLFLALGLFILGWRREGS